MHACFDTLLLFVYQFTECTLNHVEVVNRLGSLVWAWLAICITLRDLRWIDRLLLSLVVCFSSYSCIIHGIVSARAPKSDQVRAGGS